MVGILIKDGSKQRSLTLPNSCGVLPLVPRMGHRVSRHEKKEWGGDVVKSVVTA